MRKLNKIMLFFMVIFCITLILSISPNGLLASNAVLLQETVSTPVASPASGAVAAGTKVTLSTATSGATIFYTLNGNTPTIFSRLYVSPISVNSPTTIKAIATKRYMTKSAVLTASYKILPKETVSTPVASPAPGAVAVGTKVTLSTATPDARIFYTLNGTAPTIFSRLYSSPISINSAKTIKAIAVKANMNKSSILVASYTIAPPVIAVTDVTIDKTELSLQKGANAVLTATVQPYNATNKNVIWRSSNETVATVVNGVVTAVNEGTATITVTTVDGGKTASCTVTVYSSVHTIMDIPSSKDITVAQGTLASAINLPSNVIAILDDNTTVNIPVAWDTASYNKDVLGTYTFTGTPTSLPANIVNPNNKTASIKVTVIIPNFDPNPNTSLNVFMGNTLLEFDNPSELKSSASAKVDFEQGNIISGTGSAKITSLSPLPAGGTESYITVETSEILGDKLNNLNNIEFNLYIPDKTQVDYILVNLYTNTWHSTFYQVDIGSWELTPGWNKIRRSKDDIKWINSVPAAASSPSISVPSLTANATVSKSKYDISQEVTNHKNKVRQFNSMLLSKKKAAAKYSTLSANEVAIESIDPSYWNTIDNMEFFIAFKTGNTPSITFDRASYNVSGKAKILFTFDDAWHDVMKYGYPILEEKGFKATLWANMVDSQANNSDRSPSDEPMWILNESELEQMYANGWDIGNHTVNHPDIISNISDAQLTQEYKVNMDWIKNSGWLRAYEHACYPSGQFDERLINILHGLGVKSARTTVYGTQPTPVFNMYKLKSIYIGRDSVFDDPTKPDDPNKPYWIKSEIDRAVATGSTLFIMLHRVESDTADLSNPEYGPLAVTESNFRQVVQYVAGLVQQNAIEVNTVSQWYNSYIQ